MFELLILGGAHASSAHASQAPPLVTGLTGMYSRISNKYIIFPLSHSLTHSHTVAGTHFLPTSSLTHSLTHLSTHICTHSLTLTHSLINWFADSSIHSFILFHSLTHLSVWWCIWVFIIIIIPFYRGLRSNLWDIIHIRVGRIYFFIISMHTQIKLHNCSYCFPIKSELWLFNITTSWTPLIFALMQ